MSAGTKFTLNAREAGPSPTYLQFLLLSGPKLGRPDKANGAAIEVYRSPSPISGLMRERNLLSLSRVRVPPQSPCDPMHRRSGAALHYVLSGVGAEFTQDRATTKGPGSVSYEPNGLLYQWSNPGDTPLIYLLFNINPKEEPPVVESAEYLKDPFLGNSHVTWAIYCVFLSMIMTVLVAAKIGADDDHGIKTSARSRKKWWKK
jgi:hypothetical protein